MLRTLIAITFIATTFMLGLVAVLLYKDKDDDLDPRAFLAGLVLNAAALVGTLLYQKQKHQNRRRA